MTDNRDLPICKACRWYSCSMAQCFDGHLQYSGKQECEGFECSSRNFVIGLKHSESALNTSDDKI